MAALDSLQRAYDAREPDSTNEELDMAADIIKRGYQDGTGRHYSEVVNRLSKETIVEFFADFRNEATREWALNELLKALDEAEDCASRSAALEGMNEMRRGRRFR